MHVSWRIYIFFNRALHVDIQKVIEETAEFVARNSDTVFLEKLRSMDDRRFAFLGRDHLWHGYYQWKLEEAQAARAKPSDTSSELTNTPGKGAAEAQVSESLVSQEQDISAEMQKLARLQKIREMFKLKQKASKDVTEASPESGHVDGNDDLASRSISRSRSRSRSKSTTRSSYSTSRSGSRSRSRSISPSHHATKRLRPL